LCFTTSLEKYEAIIEGKALLRYLGEAPTAMYLYYLLYICTYLLDILKHY
jgi:hypothetical protein